MLENTESLLSVGVDGKPLGVLCVSPDEESLEEMAGLLQTLGVDVLHSAAVSVRKIHPATYLGEGKVKELKETLEARGAKAVIVDVELSPNQLRNLEKELGAPVLDRPGVIIEIFSRHARTKESKTQVALARMQYLLPRLAHFWNHFERQRGGGPSSRGMGEKQIEVDRRLVKTRISTLKSRLKEIEAERKLQRGGRRDVLKVALVGYTNAGKSTLLNALTQSQVLAEDKLFATLDASIRTLDPHSHPPVVAIDTVGFIDRLPPTLVASFRSTLEEVREADLLLHVVDASHPKARSQWEITENVLKDLGVEEKPRLTVLNKMDRVKTPAQKANARVAVPGAHKVSALARQDVVVLRDEILKHFVQSRMELWEIVVPYGDGKLESQLHRYGSVEVCRHLDKGTFFRVRMEPGWAKKLSLQRYRP